jgi:hypothetical protein
MPKPALVEVSRRATGAPMVSHLGMSTVRIAIDLNQRCRAPPLRERVARAILDNRAFDDR